MHTTRCLPPPSIIADFLILREPAGEFTVSVRNFGSARAGKSQLDGQLALDAEIFGEEGAAL